MFIQLFRIYFTLSDSGELVHNHSVQYFHLEDYDSVDAMMIAVQARYHNVIAADLQNASCVYNAAYIIDNGGNMIDHDVFDRRPAEDAAEAE